MTGQAKATGTKLGVDHIYVNIIVDTLFDIRGDTYSGDADGRWRPSLIKHVNPVAVTSVARQERLVQATAVHR
jgi:hypothetical protein